MNSYRMLQTMADMQHAHNRVVFADWESRSLPFYRAIWVECAELLDHFGWKWWKQQQPDLAQVKLEVVDIWHFGLSQLLLEGRVNEALAATMSAVPPPAGALSRAKVAGEDFRLAVEALALGCLRDKTFSVPAFFEVMAALPLHYEELFAQYVGKNVLNHFRQDHGYKDGSYRKLWHGREDNVHLVEVMAQLSPEVADYPGAVYQELLRRYGRA